MGREYPVYPVGEERGAELLLLYAGIDEEDFCIRVLPDEIMAERMDIHEEYVRRRDPSPEVPRP